MRRINFWGGPGSGKSTTASRLYADLKDYTASRKNPLKIELCREIVKDKAWKNESIDRWHGVKFSIDQLCYEKSLLDNVDLVISDSPIGLGAYYAETEIDKTYIKSISKEYDHLYHSINILLLREKPYLKHGRYQTEEQAVNSDKPIFNICAEVFCSWSKQVTFSYSNYSSILDYCKQFLP